MFLLILIFPCNAAYAAPIMIMSQNRHAAIGRVQQQLDEDVNMKVGYEIEFLHAKRDALREREQAVLAQLPAGAGGPPAAAYAGS